MIATAATAAIGVGLGAAKFFEGRKMQREAQKKIENFEWEGLNNPYKDLQVSTLGADLQREEASRFASTGVDALRYSGTRGLVGGLGKLQSNLSLFDKQIAAELDQQQKQIDFAGAGYDTKVNDMIEKRQMDELSGYGQLMNVGFNTKHQGAGDMLNGIGMMGQINGNSLKSELGMNNKTSSYTPTTQMIPQYLDPNTSSYQSSQNAFLNSLSNNNSNNGVPYYLNPNSVGMTRGMGTSYLWNN